MIRTRRKRQTIRLWLRARVKVGQVAYVPGLGARVRILAVDRIGRLGDLTRADAVADGFMSRRAMMEEIGRLYPVGMRKGRGIFRVRFEVVPAASLAAGTGLRRNIARRSHVAHAEGGRDVRVTRERRERLRHFLTALGPRMR